MNLILGSILDRLLADPAWLPHPIVLFGKLIAHLEGLFNRGRDRVLKGGFVAIFLITITFLACWVLLKLAFALNNYLGFTLEVIGIFFALSSQTLINEVRMVFLALKRSLEEGRRQVARIVGRDTAYLSEREVKSAALETLAENLSDGVIAPLFWFAIGGVPAMFAYKMVNTLDSMIGYKNERYLEFGRVAAKIDDIANYIPARITALLMVVVAPKRGLSIIEHIKFVIKYGKAHLSPNSGYPEAALASILDCRFGGSHNYFGVEVYKPYIGERCRDFNFKDLKIAIDVNNKTQILFTVIILVLSLFCS